MPESHDAKPHEWGWALPQRRAIIALLSIFLLAMAAQFFFNRQFVADPQPPNGARAAELASRLDPNAADWQALAAIPNLGEKRARNIVAYRDRVRSSRPGAIVFKGLYDLRAIRGIGPATAARLGAYLIFPGETPTSGPAPPEDDGPTR